MPKSGAPLKTIFLVVKRSTKQTQGFLATKQKALRGKGVDVLEGDRWNVNSRESTDKELPIQDYD